MSIAKSTAKGIRTGFLTVSLAFAATSANAGSIFLTGHDILLHQGQEGYDAVILDYLREAGTSNEIAKSAYDIAFIGTRFSGTAGFGDSGGVGNITGLADGGAISTTGSLAGYSSAKFYDAQTADWNDILANDAIVILSHTSCGGCSLTTAGSNAVNAQAAAIETAFNAGLDIWANSAADLSTYYDFLPSSALAQGVDLPGDPTTGFTPTTAGAAIGITSAHVNGDFTHNTIASAAAAFTVMERYTAGNNEIISVGLQGGQINDGEISVPEPGSLALFGLGLLGLGALRRKSSA